MKPPSSGALLVPPVPLATCLICSRSLQLRLLFPREAEAAALGAALQAAAVLEGAGVAQYVSAHEPQLETEAVEPRTEHAAAMAAAFEVYKARGVSLFAGQQ